MCWEKKFHLQFINSWDQFPNGSRVLFSIGLNCCSTLPTCWELLCEASCGSHALLHTEQIDEESYKLKVTPVERQRTLNQEHPSWNWNLPVRASLLCCVWPRHWAGLIWFLALDDESSVMAKTSYSFHQSHLWYGSKRYQFLLRTEAAHELYWGKAKIPLKSLVSKLQICSYD